MEPTAGRLLRAAERGMTRLGTLAREGSNLDGRPAEALELQRIIVCVVDDPAP
jgi:hypothetical protein